MFEGTFRRHFSLYLLVNVALVAGSPGIYSSDLTRSHRHASCPSCSRDSPAALANWDAAPYARGIEAETAGWPSGERPFEPSQPSLLSNPYSFNPPNPYGRAPGSRGTPTINRSAGGTCRRENPFVFESRDLDTDLASTPTASIHGLNAPVTPYQPRGFTNAGRLFNKASFYDLIKRQSIPPAGNDHLEYDSVELGPPLFEDPKTKLSVVYRADKYDDGSNDDPPLYPLDYPARQVADKRPDVRKQADVQVDRAERLGQVQRDQPTDSRMMSGFNNYEGQSGEFRIPQRFAQAQTDGPRNSRMTDRFIQARAEQSGDPSVTHGFINPTENQSDFRMAQRFVQPQGDPSKDFRMADRSTQPRENEFGYPSMVHGFTNLQEDQSNDFKVAQRFAQSQEGQFRDSRMADKLNHPRDQSGDPSTIDGFLNPQEDQSRDFKVAQRFAQHQDQFRDPKIADKFLQSGDQSKDYSMFQLPEVRFDSGDLSNVNVMKMLQHVGAMFGNRSLLEDRNQKNSREAEKQGDQRESQVIQKINDGDQGNKGVDPREKQLQEEAKEKRDAADRKITANDQLDWSGAELVPLQTTTELPVLGLTNIETMD